jgi:cyclophilin family peptidyl-prolyl cis-trans isomerase/HEAT repeat protein
MMQTPDRKILSLVILIACLSFSVVGQPSRKRADARPSAIPPAILLQIIRAEDERRWDDSLKKLLADSDANVRKRAALAAGRIGNEGAVPILAEMLLTDRDNDVRQMTAFALGEIESPGGAYALVEMLKRQGQEDGNVRARAVEALGKIVAAMTSSPQPSPDAGTKAIDEDRLDILRATIVGALRFENDRRSRPDRLTILLGLTAVLRAKPDGVGKLVAEFLDYSDPRIVADALNTLARLRLKEGNDKARDLLVKHSDPIVRSNAARVLGATEDKQAFDALLDRALHDADSRVGVSAIRALASLKDSRAVQPLLERGDYLLKLTKVSRQFSIEPRNELLEIVAALGRLLPNRYDESAVNFVKRMHQLTNGEAVEVEIAFARMVPGIFQNDPYRSEVLKRGATWRQISRRAQGLASIREVITGAATGSAGDSALKIAQAELRDLLTRPTTPDFAMSDILEAYNSYKPDDVDGLARNRLIATDVIIRASAAEVLGNQPSSGANTRALIDALPRALHDADNDAALAILSALAKQKNREANEAIKTGLDSKDHLIRRRAVALLKANGVGDFSDRIGTVQTRNTDADYRRAIARIGQKPTATVVTTKGSFTIEFLPGEATLNVDNFIQLAKKGYFNGQTVPRVVPNFVVQTGDPRGDQNGGPGYTIRCEINEAPYDRAAVGMALSGKDTGGSQWFVTHSPQPHLDGGYTVFGRVIRGMGIVDQIARGDHIVRVVANER